MYSNGCYVNKAERKSIWLHRRTYLSNHARLLSVTSLSLATKTKINNEVKIKIL